MSTRDCHGLPWGFPGKPVPIPVKPIHTHHQLEESEKKVMNHITINSSVAANVVLRIIAACFRIMAALVWNLAPGNHSGTYFKMGIISTKKAPGT